MSMVSYVTKPNMSVILLSTEIHTNIINENKRDKPQKILE